MVSFLVARRAGRASRSCALRAPAWGNNLSVGCCREVGRVLLAVSFRDLVLMKQLGTIASAGAPSEQELTWELGAVRCKTIGDPS